MTRTSSAVPPYFQTMSPAPSPQPSQAPASLESAETSSPPAPSPSSSSSSNPPQFPTPKLRLELRDLSHDSTQLFLDNFRCAADVSNLVQTVLHLLYTVDYKSDHAGTTTSTAPTRPAPSKPEIPQTRSVTLIVRTMGGVAYTTGIDLDDDHKEIHLSLQYIAHTRRALYPARQELLGVVCHELVHCFQWAANGTAPGGLIEGIADWVRLNAGFVPPHWSKNTNGGWDRGYQNTGYFLDWIEKTKGKGSVYRINQALCKKDYDQGKFWTDLFGQGVEDLYAEYGKSLKEEQSEEKETTSGDEVDKDNESKKKVFQIRGGRRSSIDADRV